VTTHVFTKESGCCPHGIQLGVDCPRCLKQQLRTARWLLRQTKDALGLTTCSFRLCVGPSKKQHESGMDQCYGCYVLRQIRRYFRNLPIEK
jgi:hypothetical protein